MSTEQHFERALVRQDGVILFGYNKPNENNSEEFKTAFCQFLASEEYRLAEKEFYNGVFQGVQFPLFESLASDNHLEHVASGPDLSELPLCGIKFKNVKLLKARPAQT